MFGGNKPRNNDNEAEDAEQKAAERNLIRKCIDFHNPAVLDTSNRLYYNASRSSHVRNMPYLQPHSTYLRLMGMPVSTVSAPNPSTAFLTHLAHVTRAKNSTPVMCLSWTPGGRRLLTGNQDGEFTLWDGITFGFELIMSAHDSSFRSMAWSHNRNYLLTCDAGGNIKYWSPSIAPVQSIDSHNGQPIHALSFSPSDSKFVSCGDDATVRVWDWATHSEERVLEGHGWDVKCAKWHPRSSLICSGSKDNLVKLWDPRAGSCLATLYGHKNTVTKVAWNDNGNWLITASRDQLIKMYDIRAMKELVSLKGHHKEVTSIAWHPIHETVLASGGMDGTLLFWNLGPKGSDEPAARIPYAHGK
jgi:polyadenylation factor subunit 2